MQNYIKSQTRLAFVQYIFQSLILDTNTTEANKDFQENFYNTNIAIIGEKKKFNLKFNKNLFNKLSDNYINNFSQKKIIKKINENINIERKFNNWDKIVKSLIYAIIIELNITENNKIKIVINDYINIAKSLVTPKETNLINAIIQNFIDEKKNRK
tara:strand:- start:1587 stop:2054 length:468 start_codon:yes stop_codon:yes gene_type:complete